MRDFFFLSLSLDRQPFTGQDSTNKKDLKCKEREERDKGGEVSSYTLLLLSHMDGQPQEMNPCKCKKKCNYSKMLKIFYPADTTDNEG